MVVLIAFVPPPFKVKLLSGVVLPMVPLKVLVPLAVTVKLPEPSIAPEKLKLPLPAIWIVLVPEPPTVIARLIESLPLAASSKVAEATPVPNTIAEVVLPNELLLEIIAS